MGLKFIVFAFTLQLFNVAYAAPKNIRWKINNTEWTKEFDLKYQEFIHVLGMARKKGACSTLDQCLRSRVANPMYVDMNPAELEPIYSDCADLPYVLRAYFSWMNDLPFTFPTDLVEAKGLTRNKTDIRYSKYGNIITEKYYVKNGDKINKILQEAVDYTSSGTFRTNPEKNDSGELFRDTYSVNIDRKYIVPGTVVYDPNGHVAVVYEVTKSGQIQMIDAHPDNSLTTITYGEKFPRSSQRVGGGFSNFRPFSNVNGEINARRNSELPGYSLIQYSKDPFILNGKTVTYYEYVRGMMAEGDIVYDPIKEFGEYMSEICQDMKYREESVALTIKDDIDIKEHPEILPKNIYGTDGEWEVYATPSRDARLKALVKQTRDYLLKVVKGFKTRNIKLAYEGYDLPGDLRQLYFNKANACTVAVNSEQTINLDKILSNIYLMSFDPYHCAELRWGQTPGAKCLRDKEKMKWFKAEQGLRNRILIDYTLKTDYDVDSLPDSPSSQSEQTDLSFDGPLKIERLPKQLVPAGL